MQELLHKIAEAEFRLTKTEKGSKCYRDTKRWLARLYRERNNYGKINKERQN